MGTYGYIDELVQIAMNDDPADGGEQVCESLYWATQDANFNVTALIDSAGDVVERYLYTPYGERQVFTSPDPANDDPFLSSATTHTVRWQVSAADQAYGICDVGHQGLFHDEESGLIYNRARHLHPGVGRFVQRDPLGYVDGLNIYSYVHGNPNSYVDPSGMVLFWTPTNDADDMERIREGLETPRTYGDGQTKDTPFRTALSAVTWEKSLIKSKERLTEQWLNGTGDRYVQVAFRRGETHPGARGFWRCTSKISMTDDQGFLGQGVHRRFFIDRIERQPFNDQVVGVLFIDMVVPIKPVLKAWIVYWNEETITRLRFDYSIDCKMDCGVITDRWTDSGSYYRWAVLTTVPRVTWRGKPYVTVNVFEGIYTILDNTPTGFYPEKVTQLPIVVE